MDNDLIFSLYPDPNKKESNYSIQIVDRANYYPSELEIAVDLIRKSSSTIERERAIDHFYHQISISKKKLNEIINLMVKREQINLLPIFVLVNKENNILKNTDGEIIFIAGSVLGGDNILGHELDKIEQKHEFSLVEFHADNIAYKYTKACIDEVNELICSDDVCDLNINIFPLEINSEEYSLKRAKSYYKSEYDKIASINDFSPLIDSSLTASKALIDTNLNYLRAFPDFIQEIMKEYSIKDNLNFLGIQKYTKLQSKIELLGYSFTSSDNRFAMKNGELFDGLKYLIISNTTIDKINSQISKIRLDKELRVYIREYERDIARLGVTNQFEGRLSEGIRDIIGRKSMHRMLDNASDYYYKIPLGLFKFTYGPGSYRLLLTSLDENELPDEYISVLDSFNNVAQLISQGVLRIFNYNVDTFNFHLKSKNMRFVLTIKPDYEFKDLYEGMISIELHKLDDLEFLFAHKEKDIPGWIGDLISTFDLTKLFENYNKINSKMGLLTSSKIRYVDLSDVKIMKILESKMPISCIINRFILDKMDESKLSDIINEVQNYELNMGSRRDTVSEIIKKPIKLKIKTMNSKKMIDEINNFNEGLYEFIIGSFRRGELVQSSSDIDLSAKHIFEDLKIAIVDFGLSSEQWVNADNIQLFETYKSQLSWLKHSFLSRIYSEISLSISEEDLDTLMDYHQSNNQIYNTFNGNITGAIYVRMKKAYLYFHPKILKFNENLSDINSIHELITVIEELENRSRSKIKITLPKLPKMN